MAIVIIVSHSLIAKNKSSDYNSLIIIFGYLAVLIHTASLIGSIYTSLLDGYLGSIRVLHITVWLLFVCVFILSLATKNNNNILILLSSILSCAGIMIYIHYSNNTNNVAVSSNAFIMSIHIVVSIVALSTILLTSFVAFLANIVRANIQKGELVKNVLLTNLSVQSMHKIIIYLSIISIVLIVVLIIAGFYQLNSISSVSRKIVFTTISFILFSVFLTANYKKWWGRKTNYNLIYAGTIFIFVAYFGAQVLI
jgi:ABC-type uncharacterized transport system permease subunit